MQDKNARTFVQWIEFQELFSALQLLLYTISHSCRSTQSRDGPQLLRKSPQRDSGLGSSGLIYIYGRLTPE